MKSKVLSRIGIPGGEPRRLARAAAKDATDSGWKKSAILAQLEKLVVDPRAYRDDPLFGLLAKSLQTIKKARQSFQPRQKPASYHRWGDDVDAAAVEQMENACKLPVSVSGALMPDAHVGYGLPIGGVLATRNSVIPYAVGVDIACRMKMSVLDLPLSMLDTDGERLAKAIHEETRFGIGASFRHPRQHAVIDEDWNFTPLTRNLKDKAWRQLGTSGSGNHFVEFGVLHLDHPDLGLEAKPHLTLLTHSGSRGAGATIAGHYSKLAMRQHPELPRQLQHLAWLDLESEEGQEYWQSMELMGRYAAANHAVIHRHVIANLGARLLLDVENHHNFAWKEKHGGEELIVHRKGATPAGKGVVGIIPGSMATPGFVVRCKGVEASLNSAAHGAGRRMSRTRAKEEFNWTMARRFLESRGVTLLSAGLDEVPMAYKNIEEVMAAQQDLVSPIARFEPRLVKMAPAGERPED